MLLAKRMARLLAGLVVLGMTACTQPKPGPPVTFYSETWTPMPVVPVDELVFPDVEDKRHFMELYTCINNMVDDSWNHPPTHVSGNDYDMAWCRGSGQTPECLISAGNFDDRDQHVLQLTSNHYPSTYPESTAMVFDARLVPEHTGWGVSFSFWERYGTGGTWQVLFSQYTGLEGVSEHVLYLGDRYGYRVFETYVEHNVARDQSELAPYIESAESMRDRGLAQIKIMADKVRTQITTNQIITCDRGPYMNDGIEPACTPRPITPAEEDEELTKANAYFETQETLLRENYLELYKAWMAAFPMDQCWP